MKRQIVTIKELRANPRPSDTLPDALCRITDMFPEVKEILLEVIANNTQRPSS